MNVAAAIAASSGWTFVALLSGGLLGVGVERAFGLDPDGLAAYVGGVVAAFVGFALASVGASRGAGPAVRPTQVAPPASASARALRGLTTAGAALCLSSALDALVHLLDLGPIPFLEKVTQAVAAVEFPARLALVVPFAVCPAVGEELFFRQVLWRRFPASSRRARAAVTSAVFGLAHVDPRHVVAAAALGLFLAAVRARPDGFARCVAAHLTTNAAFVLGASFGPPERPALALAASAAAFALLAARALRDPAVEAPAA